MAWDRIGQHFELFGELALVDHQTPVWREAGAPLPRGSDQRK